MPTGTTSSSRRSPAAGAARGFTLLECMIASVVLAVSAMAVTTAMIASYANDDHARDHADARDAGKQLIEEILALPMESNTSVDMNDYASFADTVDSTRLASSYESITPGQGAAVSGTGSTGSGTTSGSGTVTDEVVEEVIEEEVVERPTPAAPTATGGSTTTGTTQPTQATPATNGTGTRIQRRAVVQALQTMSGRSIPAGDLTVITVEVTTPGGRKQTVRRLVSRAESASLNRAVR